MNHKGLRMVESVMDKHDRGDINKEEGEITDDDEVEIVKTEYINRQRKQYNSRTHSSKSQSQSERHTLCSSSNDSMRYSHHGHRSRPLPDPTPSGRKYNRSESPVGFRTSYGTRSDWRGNDYDYYRGQRDHREYGRHLQSTNQRTPSNGRSIL